MTLRKSLLIPGLLVGLLACLAAVRLRPPTGPTPGARWVGDLAAPGSSAVDLSRPCAGCHPAAFEAWRGSQHAGACRAFEATRDPQPPGTNSAPAGVIGVAPFWQALVPAAGGRLQVLDPAFDGEKHEWFSVFTEAPRPDEWGHWTQRGMNWNAQCAGCHMTRLSKGYDAGADAYHTTWQASGVACAQCHGDLAGHATDPGAARASMAALRQRTTDLCGSCHSRREELTEASVGEAYDDQYRLLLADTPGLYHPDGQASDEVFELGSLALSRMGEAGVGCADCHDAHSGKLRASVHDDALCLGCHAAPGRRGAVVIDAASHSHHDPSSPGARCVSCHMPAGVYMVRDRRRDHGFSSPDPELARELGLPDACSGCHPDMSRDRAITRVEEWYGPKMAGRPARRRARAVQRARGLDATVLPELLAILRSEPNAAWRASLAGLLAGFTSDAEVRAVLLSLLDDPHPRVVAAATRSLTRVPEAQARLVALRPHPIRAVRLAAAWASRSTLTQDEVALREVRAWLAVSSDQPLGALRQSELALIEKRPSDAVAWARKAVQWDPSAPSFQGLARALAAAGKAAESREALGRARSAR